VSIHCVVARRVSSEATDQRREFAQRVKELQPEVSNRAIAEALGVSNQTINRDERGTNVPPDGRDGQQNRDAAGTNVPPGADAGRRDARIITQRDEGGFTGWAEKRLRYSRATAFRLVSVHEELGGKASQFETLSKSVLYLLAAPSTPDEVREVGDRTRPADQGAEGRSVQPRHRQGAGGEPWHDQQRPAWTKLST
jgi:hypothetical protein